MWIITGVLFGLLCLGAVIGFHAGAHTHVVAGVIGLAIAACLAYMLAEGPRLVLWSFFGADLIFSAGLGAFTWSGLSGRHAATSDSRLSSLEGVQGMTVGQLAPDGLVRLRGELWSAVSINGIVPTSTRVMVVRVAGVRVEVWGEDAEKGSTEGLFDLSEDAELDRFV